MRDQKILEYRQEDNKILSSQYPYILKQEIFLKKSDEYRPIQEMLKYIKIKIQPTNQKEQLFAEVHPNILIRQKKCTSELAGMNFCQLITLSMLSGIVIIVILFLDLLGLAIALLIFAIVFIVLLQKFYKQNTIWNEGQSKFVGIGKFKEQFSRFSQSFPQRHELSVKYEVTRVSKNGSDYEFTKEEDSKVEDFIVDYHHYPDWLDAVDKSSKEYIEICHEYRIVISKEKQLQSLERSIQNFLLRKKQQGPQIRALNQSQVHQIKIKVQCQQIPSAFIRRSQQSQLDKFISVITKIFFVHSFYLRRKIYQTDSLKVVHEFTITDRTS